MIDDRRAVLNPDQHTTDIRIDWTLSNGIRNAIDDLFPYGTEELFK